MIPQLRSLFYKVRKSRAAAPCQAPYSTMRTFASCPRRRVNRSSRPSFSPRFSDHFSRQYALLLFLISSIVAGMLPAPAFQKIFPPIRPIRTSAAL